ncbi:MAG: glycosyltransferase [Vicingaceae bacterium]
MSQKLRVLFLPKWYPSKFDRFDGNFIENHAKAVHSKCNLGVIFVHSSPHEIEKYNIEKSTPHGFTEYRIFYRKPKSSIRILNQLIGFFRYFKAQKIGYKQYLKEIGTPQLSHIHINGRSAMLALYLRLKSNIPFLLTEHWSGYIKENGAFKGYLRKLAYRYIAKKSIFITTVSTFLKKSMETHGIKGAFEIIPNVVDTSIFKHKKKKSSTVKRIIHISNLSYAPKNLHQIIEALDRVGKERTDFEFDLIGTGPDEDEMIYKLNQSSIKNRYKFYGEVSMKMVSELLSNAHFLLLYSSYETQSVVLIESFACGIPVLSSNVGGIPEYLNEKRGILIQPNQMDELISAIHKMLDGANTYDSEKMRQYAINKFSENVIAQRFLSLYEKALNADEA